MTLAEKILAIISRFPVCSLDAIHAELAAKYSARDIMGALQSLKQTGKIAIVEARKYRAI